MTTEQRVQYLNILANQDLTPAACLHKAVTVNGTIAATAALAAGFLKSHGLTGEAVRIADQGVVKAVAGAAVTTIGYPVTITTSGYVIAAVNCGYMIGKAFTAAASGDLLAIQCDLSNLGYFQG